MSHGPRGPVVVDTGVLGANLTPRRVSLASAYRPVLEGRPVVVSFITVAELRFGAMLAGWGPSRLQRLDFELGRADVVWPGPSLAGTYAMLRSWCVKAGHGLGRRSTKPIGGWPRPRSGLASRS